MKVLFVSPHPDDTELHCGGFVCKLIQYGHDVRILSVCNGNGGHHILSAEETAARRRKEMDNVANYLGIQYDVWSDVADCSLLADLPTRRRMIRYIRQYNPDIVISPRTNDYHADHRNTAILAQDASYLLTVPHECPDVPAMRFMPVIIFSEDCFSNPAFKPDIMIPIDDVITKKYEIINFHVSQIYEWLPYTEAETVPDGDNERQQWFVNHCDTRKVGFSLTADRYRNVLIEQYGEERGKQIKYAEAYELSEYGRALSKEQVETLMSL